VRLAFIADGRSPIALNWIEHFARTEAEVHLISTTPCEPDLPLASLSIIPVAFGSVAVKPGGQTLQQAWSIPLRVLIRHWFGPFTVAKSARMLSKELDRIQPDLLHAMRIPFEGMMAAQASYTGPLLLSVWGNDFTLHAPASPGMRTLTGRALKRADALHADCDRDLHLANRWGFSRGKPRVNLPGNGGVRREVFRRGDPGALDVPALREIKGFRTSGGAVVVNPRGFRSYVRNDTFFKSIPLILAERRDTLFVCPSMQGEPRAERWLERLAIADSVRLLPKLSPSEMGKLFQIAQVMASPSVHDGTPNTLLEAMACGCLPVAGDLESIREWIRSGDNGLLIDPNSPASLAEGILHALSDSSMREQAASLNEAIISERADYSKVMQRAESLYRQLRTDQVSTL
jgi:hypothetical protein